ncbi:MAG: sigma-70 family RNA polymerase sigma factor [Bacteroidaceae bacterium]|nr:sigma-70 family RNA polymerase sigma factor [Bacteroidaceae bacterium]
MNTLETTFTRMVKEQKSTIYTVCLMFSDDSAEVDDLVQQTLINLWKGFENFQGLSDIRTWVWRVAMNTCISAERKQKKRKESTTSLDSIGISSVDVGSDSQDDKQIRLLHERIHKLGVFDRAIVLLWLENMSYDEIGEIVGISAKNVSVRLVRIKEQLKNM